MWQWQVKKKPKELKKTEKIRPLLQGINIGSAAISQEPTIFSWSQTPEESKITMIPLWTVGSS